MKQYLNNKKQTVGYVFEDEGVFRKKVKGSKHLFKRHDAWGISESVLDELENDECREIRILDEDTNTIYMTTPAIFRQKGIAHDFEDPQLFLPRKEFTEDRLNDKKLPL